MNGATWQVPQVPPGSSQVVACVKRSEKMNRFPIVGTLNSGGPESEPDGAVRHQMAGRDQPQEGAIRTLRESDPPIVVRDGSAGHKAKEWAGSNASKALTAGHVELDELCQAPCLHLEAGPGTLCLDRHHVRAS
jgi:hypothetical protein